MDIRHIDKVAKLIKERDFLYSQKGELIKIKDGKQYYDIRLIVSSRHNKDADIALSDEMIDVVLNHEIEAIDSKIEAIETELKKC